MADNLLSVHRGRFFGDAAALLFALAALALPGFAATGLVLYGLRRRARAPRPARGGRPTPLGVRDAVAEATPRA